MFLEEDESTNETETVELCVRTIPIDKEKWYQFMLIPAIFCIFLYSWLHKRQRLRPDICGGRPGLPKPLYFLDDRHNRVFYVGAFSVTVWMLQEIIIGNVRFAIATSSYSEYWVRMLTSILVGIICYPIFGGVSADHVISYGIGTLYVWGLMVSHILLNYPCENTTRSDADFYARAEGVIKIVEFLPCLFWLLYLSFVYPYRFFGLLCRKTPSTSYRESRSQDLPYLVYVRNLLKKPTGRSTIILPESHFVVATYRKIARKIYVPIPGFRYSVSILSAIFVSLLLVFEIATNSVQLLLFAEGYARNYTHAIIKADVTDFGRLKALKKGLIYWMARSLENEGNIYFITTVFYFSISVAFVLSTASLFLTLKHHRKNLINSYKGILITLPHYEKSNRGLMVDALKYVGYQFAFAIWGFIIQTIVVAFLVIALRFLVLVLGYDDKHFVKVSVMSLIFILLQSLFLIFVQRVIVESFLQQRDESGNLLLAVNNRSCFVNFQYFMVFPNAAIGTYLCLWRILITILFSLWTVPRLDKSCLSRQFEKRDNGFIAYVGLLRLESSITNPTMLTFVYFLLKSSARSTTDRPLTPALLLPKSASIYRRGKSPVASRGPMPIYRKQIRNRWFLWITLARNPGLQLMRKQSRSDTAVVEVKSAEAKKGQKSAKKGTKSAEKTPMIASKKPPPVASSLPTSVSLPSKKRSSTTKLLKR